MTADTEVYRVGGTGVAWRQTGNEIVVLDLTGAVYFGLNGTGAQLWKRLIDGATSAQLLNLLSAQTDVRGTQLAADVAEFLAALEGFGLLRHRS